jgi:hypothetical protein
MSEVTKHKEFASELLQVPKRSVFCVHIHFSNSQQNYSPLLNSKVTVLAEMPIWRNPVGRIQNNLNSSNLIG